MLPAIFSSGVDCRVDEKVVSKGQTLYPVKYPLFGVKVEAWIDVDVSVFPPQVVVEPGSPARHDYSCGTSFFEQHDNLFECSNVVWNVL